MKRYNDGWKRKVPLFIVMDIFIEKETIEKNEKYLKNRNSHCTFVRCE